METLRTPVEIFYSCSDSPTDAPLLEQLDRHLRTLQREGVITTWHKRQIVPGNDWQSELDHHLNTASLILLLVSSDFLASDYCYGIEMQRALQRHEVNEACVIPLLLRPVDWKQTPFGKLRVLPRNEKPITAWRNRDAAFTDTVQGIKIAIERVQHLPPSSHHLGVWNIPYRRNPHFTGRDEQLDRLTQQLTSESQEQGTSIRRAALTQPQAIKGLGGIGKTQIAVEYAYRSRDLDRYIHTFWINAASEEALLSSFAELVELLSDFPAKGEADQRKLVEAIKRWLERCQQRWLLIFDNADDVALVSPYLPQQGNGSILLTTRADAVGSLATSVEVETMGLVEGIHLLLRRAQRFEQASDEEINLAGNIVVALDHFPLALDQAGAYIEETKCSFTDYLEIYQNYRSALLARRGAQVVHYPDSVVTTWSLSFQKVQQANPAATELLHLCAFLAPDRIPEELLKNGAIYWPSRLQRAVIDPWLYQQLIADLLKFSLVKRLVEDHILSIHRLVQVVQRDRMEPETQQHWAERVVRAINEVFPKEPLDPAAWSQCQRYLDQAQACHTLIERYGIVFAEASNILTRTGHYLGSHALYALAEPLLVRALAIREQELGAEHPATAASLDNLAGLYRTQGKYVEAEPLLVRALAIREQELGAMHSTTAISLNNLAGLYIDQGKYGEAELLAQRALAIWEQHCGAVHPTTASGVHNLAALYNRQGKYVEAEPLYKRALAIREQELGVIHPDTIASLNGLGAFYLEQEKCAEAEPLLVRALAIREQELGATHPDVAESLNNLAGLYRAQGRDTEAELLYERVLSICEKQLGGKHPSMAVSLNNLAGLYRNQGKYVNAELLYKRALVIREEELGAMHSDTASSLDDLAGLYRIQGRNTEAELLYERAFMIRLQQLGEQHPDTALSLNNLAVFYVDQGKYMEAETMYEGALIIFEQSLGSKHSLAKTVRENYALFLRKMGREEEAMDLEEGL